MFEVMRSELLRSHFGGIEQVDKVEGKDRSEIGIVVWARLEHFAYKFSFAGALSRRREKSLAACSLAPNKGLSRLAESSLFIVSNG